jgi:5'-nucleotidase
LSFIILILASAITHAETIVIIHTHNTNGVFENCDCPEHSYGALEKRAFVIDSIRKTNKNVLLIDSGDILDIRESRLLHSYIMRAYDKMNYDYWTPGDQDFVEGMDFFLNQMLNHAGKMLSSNIFYKGHQFGHSDEVQNFGVVKIGLTGTIRPDLKKYLDPEIKADIAFEDQVRSLRPVISKLKKNSNFVILVSHSGVERDRRLATEIAGINLILGAHSQTLLNQPEKIGQTYITQIGESGYRIGIIKLKLDQHNNSLLQPEVILLTKDRPEDAEINMLIKEYHSKRLKKGD